MQQLHLQNLGRVINMKQYTVEITEEALADMDIEECLQERRSKWKHYP